MKNIDHRMLGRVLMEYGEEHTPYLCRKAFILGSIEPDKNPLTYLHWQKRGKMLYGHNYENVMPSIQKLYDKLKQGGYSEVKHFYLMGKLAHYTADIFTFPHNKGFTGSIREHGMYEMELHRCMKEAFRDFAGHGKIDIKDMDTLEKLHKEYALQAGTCERDCRYIMQAVQLAEAVRTPESGGNFKRREILNYEKHSASYAGSGMVKSGSRIIYENVFTLFNFLNFSIAVLLFAVGAYSNMLFILVVLANIIIGTAQEFKAKKLVEKLTLLNRPTVRLYKGGREYEASPEDIVKGDVMVLMSGDQVCSDAVVLRGMLEVNESLLTGESDAVVKEAGSSLLSGSSVVSGKAYAEAVHVGEENYVQKISGEVKRFKKAESQLLDSMNKVTRWTGFLILPLGILLFAEAFAFRGDTAAVSVVSSSAALLGMLPKGLVLLISVSLAAGVIRLARMKILIQDIYSLESLAHVDVLCMDKTGTITDGTLKVVSVIPDFCMPEEEATALIKSYIAASDDNNATFTALKEAFGEEEIYKAVNKIPFSSVRKWGAVSFDNVGSIFIGAPEKILGGIPENVGYELDAGRRVISIGYYGDKWEDEKKLPGEIRSLYFVSMEDTMRGGVEDSIAFFQKEGVDIKVISGDHVKTVCAAAKNAGVSGWKNAVDMSHLEENADMEEICSRYTVFARVSPQQKRNIVRALKKCGHKVAMTGDGVNDLLAMREADCSIAVSDGSDAGRQIAQVVMLDSDFTGMPSVVNEGRRVVNNVTRTAAVFFIKTIYSVLVSVFCIAANIPFPFIPLQITLVDAFMEAYPSFLTVFEADTGKPEERFLKAVISRALPFGAAVAVMAAVVSQTAPFSREETATIIYIMLIAISFIAVVKSCRPFSKLRIFICVTVAAGVCGVLSVIPGVFCVTAVNVYMALYMVTAFAVSAVLILAIDYILHEREAGTYGKKHVDNVL